MDPITQKLLMASAAVPTFPSVMVEDVFGVDVYRGFGSGHDSPFASAFNTNYGVDGYYSTYFGGLSGSTPGIVDANAQGTWALNGNFTIEMWVKGSAQAGQGSPSYNRLWQLDGPSGNSDNRNLQMTINPSDQTLHTWCTGSGSGSNIALVGSVNIMDGNWHHVCVERATIGGTTDIITQYVDGVPDGATSQDQNLFNPNGSQPRMRWGAHDTGNGHYKGYISNFRITVGAAIYVSNQPAGTTFTPPTSPLTGGTMRAFYASKPFLHSMPESQGLYFTVNDVARVNTPRYLSEDIDWTEGGLLWMKCMDQVHQHRLYDTERDVRKYIRSDGVFEESTSPIPGGLAYWTAKGASHTRDGDSSHAIVPEETALGSKFTSWGFRKSKRFFDVIKWDGNNVNGRTINHNLKIEPGIIMIKNLSASDSWQVYHRSLGTTSWLHLDDSVPASTANSPGFANVTNDSFDVGSYVAVNGSTQKYIAYVFAHDPESDSVIKCENYTGNATQRKITLGWEPQYLLIKDTTATGDWWIYDAQRGGMKLYDKGKWGQATSTGKTLWANRTDEQKGNQYDVTIDATGFWLPGPTSINETGRNYVYMAIRKGPMRTPTDPKKVFSVSKAYGPNTPTYLADFPPDVFWDRGYENNAYWRLATRKMGFNGSTTGEPRMYWDTNGNAINDISYYSNGFTTWDEMKGARYGNLSQANPYIGHMMRRAPGFFDTVGYIGDAASANSSLERAIPHNLGVKPEMIVIRAFGNDVGGGGFPGYHKNCGNLPSAAASPYTGVSYNSFKQLGQQATNANWAAYSTGEEKFGTSTDTATHFYVGTGTETNRLYYSYMAYMWASCPKISKVGYYVATGTDLNIDCNFDDTARLVIINKWDSTSYYCYDSFRGITASNDPYLFWNNYDGDYLGTDYIDPYSTGFKITSSANTTLNVTGNYYFYLAIA